MSDDEDKKKAIEIAGKLVYLLMSNQRMHSWYALRCALPVLWCNNDRFTTVTEAIDAWREFSLEGEGDIRKVFGAMRYGEKDDGNVLDAQRPKG